MAESLKKLSAFSTDALHMAIKEGHLSDNTLTELHNLAEIMEKPESPGIRKVCKIVSKEELFQKMKISVEEKARTFEQRGGDYILRETLCTPINPFEMDLAQLAKHHRTILDHEDSVKVELLIVRYFRGFLYIGAKHHFHDVEAFRRWLFEECKVSLKTAYRYITLTLIVKTFPMLLIAGLCFSEIVENSKFMKQAWKDSALMKNSLSVLNPAGDEVCMISASSFGHLVQQMKQAPGYEFLDPYYVDKEDKDLFTKLNASQQQGQLKELADNNEPGFEDCLEF